MAEPSKLFLSNYVELLYENLKRQLFPLAFDEKSSSSNVGGFSKKIVVVPSPAMRSFLMWKLANDPEIGIAAGIEIIYLEQCIKLITERCYDKKIKRAKRASSLELALAIEQIIYHEIVTKNSENPLFNSIKTYLEYSEHENTLNNKAKKRLTALSYHLANLFERYGLYAFDMVSQWETTPPTHWQQYIWHSLYLKNETYTHAIKEITACFKAFPTQLTIDLHIFALSYIPSLYHRLLYKCQNFFKVNYYLLSPCQTFWSDTLSNIESSYMQAYWRKRGISLNQQEALDEYLRDKNPLLANFGKLGREMAQQIENLHIHTQEVYLLPSGLQNVEQYRDLLYDDLYFESNKHPLTLLKAIQADITLLRSPNEDNKIFFPHYDHSIQVHCSPNHMREVQIVYDIILKTIKDSNQNDMEAIHPKDIIVMMPDVALFQPYIKAIFNSTESILTAQILDLHTPAQSRLVQAFLHLLDLSTGRFDVLSLLELFEHPAFCIKYGIKNDDLINLKNWLQAASICWGADGYHKQEIIEYHHSNKLELCGDTSKGSWAWGIDRLLAGFAIMCENDEFNAIYPEISPVDAITGTQAVAFGRWIEILRSLRIDLKPLMQNTEKNLSEWTEYLLCLYESYFSADIHNEKSIEEEIELRQIITKLSAAKQLKEMATFINSSQDSDERDKSGSKRSDLYEEDIAKTMSNEEDRSGEVATGQISDEIIKVTEKTTFPFSSIRFHLQQLLEEKIVHYRETLSNAVRFCSMLPMKAIPARIIILMGMVEGAFPKIESLNSLNLMNTSSSPDYIPSKTDFDRHLFLETLLSARDKLIITYVGYNEDDGKEILASSVVNELLHYMDATFTINGSSISNFCVFQHPFDNFDYNLFTVKTPIPTYSRQAFNLAKAYYQSSKHQPKTFINRFSPPQLDVNADDYPHNISLSDLEMALKNPLKLYFNRTLNMFISNPEDEQIKNEESFIVDNLTKWKIRQQAMKYSAASILQSSENLGLLPNGLFGTYNYASIENNIKNIHDGLNTLQINHNALYEIEFSPHVAEPMLMNNLWLVPILNIPWNNSNSQLISLSGKINNICHKGLIIDSDSSFKGLYRNFCRILMFNAAIDIYNLPFENSIIHFDMKNGLINQLPPPSVDYKHQLSLFSEYFCYCIKKPSPLIAEWIKEFIQGTPEKLKKTIQGCMREENFYNQYALWLFRDGRWPDFNDLFEQWNPLATQLYGVLLPQEPTLHD